jgi:alkanesulfonate monooxygenase SsuD/methylene tetrahydromethanopterin reductase-like flavin-dependent oxidoreductase (luciferase family)
VEIDVGLDSLGLAYDSAADITAEAARLGYTRIWVGSVADPFQTCALRWSQTRAVVPGGVSTAIGVVPVGMRTPADLAQSAAALSQLTGGRFVLGIGAGTVYERAYRRAWGIAEDSSLALVSAYLQTMRAFQAGEPVTYTEAGLRYDGALLAAEPTATPLYVGAAGPQMITLGGELADGIYLSWCTPDAVSWTRARIVDGAARAGREPARVTLAASARVCVDDDEDTARRALAAALLPYLAGWGGGARPRAFRASFERMGFAAEIAEIDRLSESGAGREQIIEAFPDRMLRGLGYFGPAAGAAEAVRRQVAGADTAVVRVVPARPGADAIRAVLAACQPGAAAGLG